MGKLVERQLPRISRDGLYLDQCVAPMGIDGDDVVRGHITGEGRRDKTSP
jgi:hypothetical protein